MNETNTFKVFKVVHGDALKVLEPVPAPFTMTEKCRRQVESHVKKWLNEEGVESPYLSVRIGSVSHGKVLTFFRIETSVRTCANCWDVYHLAKAVFWDGLISSGVKCCLCDNTMTHEYGRSPVLNELRGCNYNNSGGDYDYVNLAKRVKAGIFDKCI